MSIAYSNESSSTVEFSVDVHSEIAAYQQIENQVRFAITSGAIESGEPLPSVREMAASTGINANTVTKAYRDLELMKIIVTRRGVGVQVAPQARKLCRDGTLEMVQRHIRMSIGEAIASGMTDKVIKDILQEALTERVQAYEPRAWN
jgi:GntR family transcriptional regulator